MRLQRRPKFLALAVVCFAIAVTIPTTDLFLRSDAIGKIVFCMVWSFIGVVWLGSYFGAFFGRE